MITWIGAQRDQIRINLNFAHGVSCPHRLAQEAERSVPAPGELTGNSEEKERLRIGLGKNLAAFNFF